MYRRTMLAGTSLALSGGIVGCVDETDTGHASETSSADGTENLSPEDINPADLDGYIQPKSPGEPIEELECDIEGAKRHSLRFSPDALTWGNVEQDGTTIAALRIDSVDVERGADVTITLTNVSDGTIDLGYENSYNLVVKTENGWQDVRVWANGEEKAFPEPAIEMPSGSEYEWNLTLAESGLRAGHYHSHEFEICPGLPEGRYSFVYWAGLSFTEPIAVAFDLSG